ncbi:uncharacterized protein LOC111252118 [Varroa destructor]|uniref:Uncharacterized protein n=1 Tax=Varroa destructor TaxID=109461 RepID=A0A7M7KSQ3_VARDE|nr:uncharacterized protein LOC111252118 [Varroa destructor]
MTVCVRYEFGQATASMAPPIFFKMAKFGRFVLLALFALVLYEQCMANVEQLVQVFETVVDLLAASDKASKLKEDMHLARPCLDSLVMKTNEDTLDQVLKGMVPLAMKCGTELMKEGQDKEKKKKVFIDCLKQQSGDFLESLPDREKDAFQEANNCIKAIFTDME